MIELEPFLTEDFDRFISWINSEADMVQFAGTIFTYPLTHGQLEKYVGESTRKPFKIRLKLSGEIIGHCELNLRNAVPRLSRIIIGSKQLRNLGIGKQIVKSMLEEVFATTTFDCVDLSVFDWNINAIAAYKAVGFKIMEGQDTIVVVGNQTWKAYTMAIGRIEYLRNNNYRIIESL